MGFLVATQSDWFLIGWIAKGLGFVMNWIFEGLNLIGLPNIGIAIIIFTVVIKAIMIPLSIKQQKYSKLQSIMSPEMKAIQDKYKGKSDSASVSAQQAELKDLYEKYGTSPTGGCIQLLIQMPILFALYQVIYHLPGYINRLRDYYEVIANKIIETGSINDPKFENFVNGIKNFGMDKITDSNIGDHGFTVGKNNLIDMIYSFTGDQLAEFKNIFANNTAVVDAINQVSTKISEANMFLGMDLADTPWNMITSGIAWWAVLIPVFAGVLQWLSAKLGQNQAPQPQGEQGGMAGAMKGMNVIFPLMSVVFCFMFQAGIGIYWVASSGVQVIIQLFVNSYINKTDINDMVAKNIEKLNVKRAKKGLPPKKVTNVTNVVHNLEENKKREEQIKKNIAARTQQSSDYYERTTTARKGSLSEKAGMVKQYEERQKELKSKGKK